MQAPRAAVPSPSDPRRAALVASLRRRWLAAEGKGDGAAKQALFQEAVYLGIQPGDYQDEPAAA
jgi:hypothetical protein